MTGYTNPPYVYLPPDQWFVVNGPPIGVQPSINGVSVTIPWDAASIRTVGTQLDLAPDNETLQVLAPGIYSLYVVMAAKAAWTLGPDPLIGWLSIDFLGSGGLSDIDYLGLSGIRAAFNVQAGNVEVGILTSLSLTFKVLEPESFTVEALGSIVSGTGTLTLVAPFSHMMIRQLS